MEASLNSSLSHSSSSLHFWLLLCHQSCFESSLWTASRLSFLLGSFLELPLSFFFFFGDHLKNQVWISPSLGLSNIMASSSETSEVCSPAGSILITRTPEDLVPFRFFTGVSEVKTALGEALPHIGPDDSKPPNVVRSQEQDSGDWIHWDTLDPAVLRLTSDESESLEFYTPKTSPQCPPSVNQNDSIHKEAAVEPQPTYKPFHKWMRTLRRRAGRRQHGNTIDEILFQSTSVDAPRPKAPNTSHRRDSSSGSSFGFVEAVKTASASLASGSVFARSRRNSMRSSQTHTHTDRSSRASISSKRYSEDSGGLDRPQILDKDAVERSLQRRRILEELISTEEGYIGDVRFLMNVSCLRIRVLWFVLLKT